VGVRRPQRHLRIAGLHTIGTAHRGQASDDAAPRRRNAREPTQDTRGG